MSAIDARPGALAEARFWQPVAGVDELANAVTVPLGPKGRNVVI